MFTDAVDREYVDTFKDHGFVDITEGGDFFGLNMYFW